MKLNRKSLIMACIVTFISVNTWAIDTTSSSTSSSSVTVTETDTMTHVSRVESSSSISSSHWHEESRTSGTSVSTGVGIGVGRAKDIHEKVLTTDYIMADVDILLNPYRDTPGALKVGKGITIKNDAIIEHGVLATMKQGGKWGVLRPDGTVAIEPKYKSIDDADYATGNMLVHIDKKNTTWVTPSGEEISEETAFKERVKSEGGIQYLSDQYTSFKEKGKYGFKDNTDAVVLNPKYRQVVTHFSEDRAFVRNEKGKIVAIDGSGQELFEAPSKEIYAYRDGLAEYRRSVSGFNLGGLLGGFVLGGIIGGSVLDGGHYYHVGGFVYDGAKRGYIDRDGTIIIDSKNDKVWPITQYGTVVQNKGVTTFVNRKGETVIPGGKYSVGEMDRYNGFLALKDEGSEKWGVFDVTNGKQIVAFTYDSISFAGFDRLVVTKDNVRNLVQLSSGRSMYAAPTDATIEPFNTDTVTWVHKGKSDYSIIDNDGHTLFKDTDNVIQEVRGFNHGYAPVKSKGKWGIMNAKGEWLVSPTYDAITIL